MDDKQKPQDVKDLHAKKFELIAKARELKAEIAKLNIELVRKGVAPNEVACW